MAMSLERDAQMESLLRGRKRELGIDMDFDSGMRLGRQLVLSHGLGRGRGYRIIERRTIQLPPTQQRMLSPPCSTKLGPEPTFSTGAG